MLQRSVRRNFSGVFKFKSSPNSLYAEQQYLDLFLAAAINDDDMVTGISHDLNEQAASLGLQPVYSRGRRKRKDGSYLTDEEARERKYRFERLKYYPDGQTFQDHIWKEYEIVNGELLHNGYHGYHTPTLRTRIEDIIRGAVKRGEILRLPEEKYHKHALFGITATFDFHDQDYWGLDNPDVTHTRAEGTTLAYRYGSSRMLCVGAEYCLPPIKFERRIGNVGALRNVFDDFDDFQIDLDTIILDRQFFDSYVINFLTDRVHYIITVNEARLDRKTMDKIATASTEHVTIIEGYVIAPGTNHSAKTILIIVPAALQALGQRKRPKKYPRSFVYATNIPLKGNVTQDDIDSFGYELSRVYKLHWGIETDWSVFKSFRARTRSRKAVIRLFYFYASVLFYNSWVLTRRVHGKRCKRVLTRVAFFNFYLPVSRIEIISAIFVGKTSPDRDMPNG